jgi:hypothetical protein
MTELNRLPPDQRAVLSLVLDRGKSYSQVADMLAIPESAVRDRAHAALDALANGATASGSGGGGGAARGSGAPSPSSGGQVGLGELEARSRREPPASVPPASVPPASAPRASAPRPRAPLSSSSRRGGALLLAAIVAVIVVAVILISSGGKGKGSASTSSTSGSASSSTPSSSTSNAGTPKLNKTIKLTSTEPSLKADGEAYVLSERGRRAFYVAIQGLPPSSGFFYAVWLYTSPSRSAPLGRAPTVSSTGRMEGGGPLPTNAGSYQQLIITRETSTHPTHPGPIVLRGTFGLS